MTDTIGVLYHFQFVLMETCNQRFLSPTVHKWRDVIIIILYRRPFIDGQVSVFVKWVPLDLV